MIRLVPDWKQAWKYASVQFTVLFAFLSAGFEYLAFFPQYMPPSWVKYAFLVVLVGRLVTSVSDASLATVDARQNDSRS